ncbi:germ cell nuclear acidic protein isoform X2 [Phyllopteryx taeniolatus]|uniref:germ cell nuclear acidic protein isoform X2 n=1 Tax=Phyllopteryx taeniolatus TaxID=161469 RepID=UPI002AD45530|nr:germ cell nuclear acidic protein isoform X2 [Phyllopteryx taeniolatus]
MSDHSSSTGSSGSSANSWTLLSPEEAAVDNAGPLDDGTESLGDAPSLSEDVAAGAAAEIKPSDIPVECILSEEGHQPDEPAADDPQSQAPVIHDIVTSSPGDNEHPGVAFVSGIDFGGPLDVAEPEETLQDAEEPVTDEPEPIIATDVPAETVETASEPSSHRDADITQDDTELPVDPVPADDVMALENGGSAQEDESIGEKEEEEWPSELEMQEEQGEEERPTSCHDDGLRRRTIPPCPKMSDEEEEEDEVELRLPEGKEEQTWWTMNKCIVGAAVLLFLGALFLSGDLDAVDVNDAEQSQKPADPQSDTGSLHADEKPTEFKAALGMFDTDASGDVSAKELGTVLRMLGENPLRQELEAIIKEVNDYADRKLHLKESHERPEVKQDGSERRRRMWEHLEKIRREIAEGVERLGERWKKDQGRRHKDTKEKDRKHRDEWETKKPQRRLDREERRKEKPWRSRQKQRSHDLADFWRAQEQKLRRPALPRRSCASVEDCAAKDGLFPVELPEFQELLEGYLGKLAGSPKESKDFLRWLVADFFSGGVFAHDRRVFADFAEDVADILEDMADVAEGGDDVLEEAMEEFEREALWKFAATEQ